MMSPRYDLSVDLHGHRELTQTKMVNKSTHVGRFPRKFLAIAIENELHACDFTGFPYRRLLTPHPPCQGGRGARLFVPIDSNSCLSPSLMAVAVTVG